MLSPRGALLQSPRAASPRASDDEEPLAASMEGHRTHAPLSAEQTHAIAQQLHDQIRELQAEVNGVRRDAAVAGRERESIRGHLAESQSAIAGLREGSTRTNEALDGMRLDLSRSQAELNDLQATAGGNYEKISQLEHHHQVAGSNATAMRTTMEELKQRTEDLSMKIDVGTYKEIGDLKEGQELLSLKLRTLQDVIEQATRKVQEQREAHRLTDSRATATQNKIEEMSGVLETVRARQEERSNSLERLRSDLKQTDTVAAKLHGDHEQTKRRVRAAEEEQSRDAPIFARMQEDISKQGDAMHSLGQRVDDLNSNIRASQKALGSSGSGLKLLRERLEACDNSIAELEARLAEVHDLAHRATTGLQETNEMVLPNLFPSRACSHGYSRGGQATPLSPMSPMSPRMIGSSRGRRNAPSPLSRLSPEPSLAAGQAAWS